jgi:hypothetical protein
LVEGRRFKVEFAEGYGGEVVEELVANEDMSAGHVKLLQRNECLAENPQGVDDWIDEERSQSWPI